MKNFMVWCWSIIVLLLVICGFNSWFVVGPGYNWFTITLGKVNSTVYTDGLHFKTPFITKSVKYNVQTQKLDATADASSKDLQSVGATIVAPTLCKSLLLASAVASNFCVCTLYFTDLVMNGVLKCNPSV